MASEVDICNLALSHIGDSATVASLYPPEGSAQAEHCARFYPIARDSMLEMHSWGFATKRAQLAQLTAEWPEWAYCYAMPIDAVNILAIMPQDASDDYSQGKQSVVSSTIGTADTSIGGYATKPFSCEANSNGDEVILTDVENAVVRYSAIVTDTSKYSPLFVTALSWYLASMIAGPIIKGDVGAAEAKRCAQMAMTYLNMAKDSDATQRKSDVVHSVSWMSGR